MALASWLQNSKIIGEKTAGLLSGKGIASLFNYSTPAGGNIIPDTVVTKGMKMFSTQAENANLPKPKTLYFVYFNLNPDLPKYIAYKTELVKELSGKEIDGSDVNAMTVATNNVINNMFKGAAKSMGLGDLWDKADKMVQEKKQAQQGNLQRMSLADYIPDIDVFNKLSYEISKLVKGYDKPSVNFDVSELNEYNRKRLVYKDVKYQDVTVTFYDVKDNPIQQFFNAYLKFICGDFLCKDHNLWEAPINNNHWQNAEGYKTVEGKTVNPTYVGNLNSYGFNIDSNFRLINRISFCEYYMDRLMVYTIENPVITAIKWGDSKMGDFSSNDIQVTFKYEGITNDLVDITPYNVDWTKKINNDVAYTRYMVNKEIKRDVATFLQTRYNTVSNNIGSDITSIIKGYMNGDVKFSWNTLKNQALDTARKYGFANEANTIAQAQQTIKNFNSKDGKGKSKYLVNMATDPTSLIGKMSAASFGTRNNLMV